MTSIRFELQRTTLFFELHRTKKLTSSSSSSSSSCLRKSVQTNPGHGIRTSHGRDIAIGHDVNADQGSLASLTVHKVSNEDRTSREVGTLEVSQEDIVPPQILTMSSSRLSTQSQLERDDRMLRTTQSNSVMAIRVPTSRSQTP